MFTGKKKKRERFSSGFLTSGLSLPFFFFFFTISFSSHSIFLSRFILMEIPAHTHTYVEHVHKLFIMVAPFFQESFFPLITAQKAHISKQGKLTSRSKTRKARETAVIFFWHLCFNRFQSFIISRQSEMAIWQIFTLMKKSYTSEKKCKIKTIFPAHSSVPEACKKRLTTPKPNWQPPYSFPQPTGMVGEEERKMLGAGFSLKSTNTVTTDSEGISSAVHPPHPCPYGCLDFSWLMLDPKPQHTPVYQ